MNRSKETIKLENLSTGYGGHGSTKVVSAGLNASIYSGRLTCLLGVNGAGKSTLLRTLSAFQPPVEGRVCLLGKPLDEYAEKELAKLIGVVLTEKPDLRNMTVEELVGLGRSPYTGFWGGLDAHDHRVVDEAITMVHIEALRNRMVHTLSDGERQKVMIAKALAQETPVIYLDEPTAFLDYPSKVEIMLLLHRLTRTMDKTVFLSTHDLELALQVADCIWLMEKGSGLIVGSPEELSANGCMAHFFGGPGITFDAENRLFRVVVEESERTNIDQ